jgi:hypothetical protein
MSHQYVGLTLQAPLQTENTAALARCGDIPIADVDERER